MRTSIGAVVAVGSVFALTAAAASAIAVTGPFDTAGGLGAASTCDIGDTVVETITDGSSIIGFTVTTGEDSSYTPADGALPASGQAACENATIWVRVDFTYLPSEDDPKTIYPMYAWFPANGDYTHGKTLLMGGIDDTDWWIGTKGRASWYPSMDTDPDLPWAGVWLNEGALVRSEVLVSETRPLPWDWAPEYPTTPTTTP